MPDKQAEAVIKLMAQQGEDLVTKADVEALRADMATKIADLRADMATKITDLRDDMATKADIKALQSDNKADIAELKVSIFLALFGLLGLMIAAIKLL